MRGQLADTGVELPGRVFISHAYDDAELVRALIASLPERVETVIFPRLDVDPKNAVSNGIVETILSCGGLIYLEGGRSTESRWVNFERDYALRAGLKVFAFKPETNTIRIDRSDPMPLAVQLVVSDKGQARAERLLAWLRTERHIAFDVLRGALRRPKEIFIDLYDLILDGRTCLWLIDKDLVSTAVWALDAADDGSDLLTEMFEGDLEPDERPDGDYLGWLLRNGLYVRLDDSWDPAALVDGHYTTVDDEGEEPIFTGSRFIRQSFLDGAAIDLVYPADRADVDWNRADDLLVRLMSMVQASLRDPG
ncbi:TIR domain-containing protein [Dactylosporangium sp. NPDC049525]|uniref:TIR domain-containing protein n=1 Tax=Dactylosporangium sp. NPDC049525 TaxID=3154730 RepID=UPI003429F5F0